MKKIGVAFLLIAFLLWIVVPTFIVITDVVPEDNIFIAAFVIAIIGSLLILVDVAYDRYKENKEDKENNDYRKY